MSGQSSNTTVAQNAATADGNGTNVVSDGYEKVMVEVQKSGTGTTNVNLEGSDDGGTTWYAMGYEVVDATAAPARAVAAIAFATGTLNHVYQVLDAYPLMRARLSGTVAPVSVTVRFYTEPV